MTALLSTVLGFAGVLLGAAISFFTQRSANKAQERRLLIEFRLHEYLSTVDCASDVLVNMERLGRALSGRIEPNEESTEEEIEEAAQRDADGAKAIDGLFSGLSELRRYAYRVSIFGDEHISSLSKSLIEEIEVYFTMLFEEAVSDGVFRASKHNVARDELEQAIDNLVKAIQEELK